MIKILRKLKINFLFYLRRINLIILDSILSVTFKLLRRFKGLVSLSWLPFSGSNSKPSISNYDMAMFLVDKKYGLYSHEEIKDYMKKTDWQVVKNAFETRRSHSGYCRAMIKEYDITKSFDEIWGEAKKHYPNLTAQETEEFKELLKNLHDISKTHGVDMREHPELVKVINNLFKSTDDSVFASLKTGKPAYVSKVNALYQNALSYVDEINSYKYVDQITGASKTWGMSPGKFARTLAPDLLRFLSDPARYLEIAKSDFVITAENIDLVLNGSNVVSSTDHILSSKEGLINLMDTHVKWPSTLEERFDFSSIGINTNFFEKIHKNFKNFDFKTELDEGLLYLDFLDKWSHVRASFNIEETLSYWRGEYFFLFSFIGLVLFYSKRPHFKVEYGFAYITAPLFIIIYSCFWSLSSQVGLFINRQKDLFIDYKDYFFNEGFVHVYGFSADNTYFNGLFMVDNFTIFIKTFISFCLILFLWAMAVNLHNSYDNKSGSLFKKLPSGLFSLFTDFNLNTKGQFYKNLLILLPITTFFLLFLVSSNNFLSLFVSLEGATLCLYILAGLRVDNRLSSEAGLKYFLMSALFSCVFGAGVFLLYLITGSMDFFTIREVIYCMLIDSNIWNFYSVDYLLNISVIMIVVVFLMKLGGAPYQYWIGDVYQGSPLIVTTFFATIVRIGFFSIFFKLICNVFIYMQFNEVFVNILYFSGFFSILVGSFLALSQTEIKRFLAYSSIVHTGFILIGLSTMTFNGFKSSLLYMVMYIFTLMGFLLCLIVFKSQLVQNVFNKGVLKIKNINFFTDLQGLPIGRQLVLVIFLFSMAGLPPFPGFLIKLYIFKDYILNLFYDIIQYNLQFNLETSYQFFGFFSFTIIVLISILTGFNYIRLITGSLFMTPSVINDKPIFNSVNFNKVSEVFSQLMMYFVLLLNLVLIFYIPSFYNSNFLNMVVSSLTFSFSEALNLFPYRFN